MKKKVVIFITIGIIMLISIIGYYYIQRQRLKIILLEDWERVEKGSTGTYYTLELDFSEDTIEYNFHSGYSWLDSTIAEYEYKIINSHQLEIDSDIYDIRFNEEKTMMTITPSLTDSASNENWFIKE